MKQVNQTDFLLDVFERFGKSNAQAALDFVRKNQAEKSEKGSDVKAGIYFFLKFDNFYELKAIIGNGYKILMDYAKQVNNLYVRDLCADNLDEKDLEILKNYSSAIFTIADTKRKVCGEKHVSEFQVIPFEAIDLGLPSGRKWANMNIGSDSEEEPGMYFDQYEALELVLDDGWALPSDDDFVELDENCTHEFCEVNGVKGMKFISKLNGNYIFLPAAGYYNGTPLYNRGTGGSYWSRSIHSNASHGYCLNFNSGAVYPQSNIGRYFGQPVRAVQ